ncbi:autotransporter-associated beta strand repeat-containing protein [Haloferula sp. BvORR071]|uniref:autotransporter-associated beta strand repeat-containing protein n=1 Tax=Haloferula sp. BvORR071 TaxID=1396141 RepID=UPI000552BF34|nr:autotransporter-associated beta strand repeat-containing protein [Haloferula sp. BvORR071]
MRVAGLVALASAAAHAAPLLTPGDPIFAYDLDTAGGATGSVTYPAVNYPGNENPPKAVDGLTSTKYLNQSKYSAGIIVTPTTAAAAKSIVLTTANDAAERDPSSYIILGTNQPITSTDKSNGFADHWTYITQGTLSLPTTRNTTAAAIDIPNTKSFSSYWIVFPTTRDTVGNNLMQIAEIQLYTGTGGTGTPIFAPGNPTLCTGWNSSIAGGEFVSRVIDGNGGTKYLNFGEENSGFFVVPSVGASVVTSFQLTTANDSDVRDPSSWTLHGMAPNGVWTQIAAGTVTLPNTRGTLGPIIPIGNTNPYLAYRMTFPTVRTVASANSMQVAECQLFGTILPANDSDFDGMDDAWETLHGLVVGTNDGAGNLDNDGSTNLQEYQRGTLPDNPDTDGDGLFDGVESDSHTFVNAADTGSNPLNPDSDSDTYSDGYEVAHGTDPNVPGSIPTIAWDVSPGSAGAGDSVITGGSATWANLASANWTTDAGANNITWDNAGQRKVAIFGGTSGTVTLSGGIDADRVIVNTDGYVFTGDTLTLGASAPMINVTAGTTVMSQVIAGTGGFIKQGNGILRLTGSASNTYTGTTSLKGIGKIVLAKDPGQIAIPGDIFLDSFSFTANNSGLVLGGDEQIADTSIVSWANIGQADTYFRLNGHKETIGGLVSTGVGGFVVLENRGFGDASDYPTGELVIKPTGSNSYSYNGNIRDIDGGTLGGKVAITKDGTGTQTLSGNLSYTGPTKVLGGTLVLANNLAGSAVTVETGGTLSGTGTLGQVTTVNAGGTIAPGANGVGNLNLANTVIAGRYACQLSGATADRLTVTGDLDVTGAVLELSVVSPLTGTSYILASNSGIFTGSFSVVGLPAGYTIKEDGVQVRLVKDGYSAWATLNGLSGDEAADFDHDGLADSVEYVLGSDPKVPSAASAPVPAVVGSNFTFTFQRARTNMTEDVSVVIEVGTDLGAMNTLFNVGADTASSSGGVTVITNGATDTVTLTLPLAPDIAKFARLTVTVDTP